MPIPFAARPSGTAIAKRAWRSLGAGFAAMTPIFVCALLLGAAVGALVFALPQYQAALVRPKLVDISFLTVAAYVGAHLGAMLFWSAVTAPVAVAVHRFILLDDASLGFVARIRPFFLWLFGLRVAFFGILAVCSLLMAAVAFVQALVALLVTIGVAIAWMHIALIFPAVAIDVPAPGAEARIDASVAGMQGHFWLFVRALVIANLPLFVILAPVTIYGGRHFAALQGAGSSAAARLVFGAFTGAGEMAGVMLAAAVASWMYAWVRQAR